ncbi:MAG: hypothetical protein P8X39_01115 [Desulfofustis sp.]
MPRSKEPKSPKSDGNSHARNAALYQKIADHIRWCITDGKLDRFGRPLRSWNGNDSSGEEAEADILSETQPMNQRLK